MPDPNSPMYQEAVAEAAWPAIRASGGRAFVLCTSLRAMRRIRELLQEKLAGEGLDLPLLMQGEGSRTELLERFRFLGNAILVASQSFWEGVDVRGEALSLVVIDKLPFAPPDDPVLSARIDKLRRDEAHASAGVGAGVLDNVGHLQAEAHAPALLLPRRIGRKSG